MTYGHAFRFGIWVFVRAIGRLFFETCEVRWNDEKGISLRNIRLSKRWLSAFLPIRALSIQSIDIHTTTLYGWTSQICVRGVNVIIGCGGKDDADGKSEQRGAGGSSHPRTTETVRQSVRQVLGYIAGCVTDSIKYLWAAKPQTNHYRNLASSAGLRSSAGRHPTPTPHLETAALHVFADLLQLLSCFNIVVCDVEVQYRLPVTKEKEALYAPQVCTLSFKKLVFSSSQAFHANIFDGSAPKKQNNLPDTRHFLHHDQITFAFEATGMQVYLDMDAMGSHGLFSGEPSHKRTDAIHRSWIVRSCSFDSFLLVAQSPPACNTASSGTQRTITLHWSSVLSHPQLTCDLSTLQIIATLADGAVEQCEKKKSGESSESNTCSLIAQTVLTRVYNHLGSFLVEATVDHGSVSGGISAFCECCVGEPLMVGRWIHIALTRCGIHASFRVDEGEKKRYSDPLKAALFPPLLLESLTLCDDALFFVEELMVGSDVLNITMSLNGLSKEGVEKRYQGDVDTQDPTIMECGLVIQKEKVSQTCIAFHLGRMSVVFGDTAAGLGYLATIQRKLKAARDTEKSMWLADRTVMIPSKQTVLLTDSRESKKASDTMSLSVLCPRGVTKVPSTFLGGLVVSTETRTGFTYESDVVSLSIKSLALKARLEAERVTIENHVASMQFQRHEIPAQDLRNPSSETYHYTAQWIQAVLPFSITANATYTYAKPSQLTLDASLSPVCVVAGDPQRLKRTERRWGAVVGFTIPQEEILGRLLPLTVDFLSSTLRPPRASTRFAEISIWETSINHWLFVFCALKKQNTIERSPTQASERPTEQDPSTQTLCCVTATCSISDMALVWGPSTSSADNMSCIESGCLILKLFNGSQVIHAMELGSGNLFRHLRTTCHLAVFTLTSCHSVAQNRFLDTTPGFEACSEDDADTTRVKTTQLIWLSNTETDQPPVTLRAVTTSIDLSQENPEAQRVTTSHLALTTLHINATPDVLLFYLRGFILKEPTACYSQDLLVKSSNETTVNQFQNLFYSTSGSLVWESIIVTLYPFMEAQQEYSFPHAEGFSYTVTPGCQRHSAPFACLLVGTLKVDYSVGCPTTLEAEESLTSNAMVPMTFRLRLESIRFKSVGIDAENNNTPKQVWRPSYAAIVNVDGDETCATGISVMLNTSAAFPAQSGTSNTVTNHLAFSIDIAPISAHTECHFAFNLASWILHVLKAVQSMLLTRSSIPPDFDGNACSNVCSRNWKLSYNSWWLAGSRSIRISVAGVTCSWGVVPLQTTVAYLTSRKVELDYCGSSFCKGTPVSRHEMAETHTEQRIALSVKCLLCRVTTEQCIEALDVSVIKLPDWNLESLESDSGLSLFFSNVTGVVLSCYGPRTQSDKGGSRLCISVSIGSPLEPLQSPGVSFVLTPAAVQRAQSLFVFMQAAVTEYVALHQPPTSAPSKTPSDSLSLTQAISKGALEFTCTLHELWVVVYHEAETQGISRPVMRYAISDCFLISVQQFRLNVCTPGAHKRKKPAHFTSEVIAVTGMMLWRNDGTRTDVEPTKTPQHFIRFLSAASSPTAVANNEEKLRILLLSVLSSASMFRTVAEWRSLHIEDDVVDYNETPHLFPRETAVSKDVAPCSIEVTQTVSETADMSLTFQWELKHVQLCIPLQLIASFHQLSSAFQRYDETMSVRSRLQSEVSTPISKADFTVPRRFFGNLAAPIRLSGSFSVNLCEVWWLSAPVLLNKSDYSKPIQHCDAMVSRCTFSTTLQSVFHGQCSNFEEAQCSDDAACLPSARLEVGFSDIIFLAGQLGIKVPEFNSQSNGGPHLRIIVSIPPLCETLTTTALAQTVETYTPDLVRFWPDTSFSSEQLGDQHSSTGDTLAVCFHLEDWGIHSLVDKAFSASLTAATRPRLTEHDHPECVTDFQSSDLFLNYSVSDLRCFTSLFLSARQTLQTIDRGQPEETPSVEPASKTQNPLYELLELLIKEPSWRFTFTTGRLQARLMTWPYCSLLAAVTCEKAGVQCTKRSEQADAVFMWTLCKVSVKGLVGSESFHSHVH